MELLDPHSYIEDRRPFWWLELLLYDLYDDDDDMMMMMNGHLLKCQTHHSITFTWSKGCPRSVALLLNPLGRDNWALCVCIIVQTAVPQFQLIKKTHKLSNNWSIERKHKKQKMCHTLCQSTLFHRNAGKLTC